jgi:hypothetical protein
MRIAILILFVMVMLVSCVTSWTNKSSVQMKVGNVPVECQFVTITEKGEKLKTENQCSFEVLVGKSLFKCTISSPTVGYEVNLETDCKFMVEVE